MANSKHVEEVLGALRGNTLTKITLNGTEVAVLAVDPYPEETNNVFNLANGKKISTDDLEFSDLVTGESEIQIILGNYTFTLSVGKS
jgi:hypothetical protein